MSVGPIDGALPRVPLLQPHEDVELSGTDFEENAFEMALKEVAPAKPGASDLFVETVGRSAELGHKAGDMSAAFARGTLDDLHGTMIAAKEAEISVKLVGTIRTKLLESFQELWRINV